MDEDRGSDEDRGPDQDHGSDAGPGWEHALAYAADAHAGQTRKGEPFLLHPLRVLLRVGTDAERTVAALHDVVENTARTWDDLRAAGFGDDVIAACDALTRRDGEDYFAYCRRAAADPLARRVKLADLDDNIEQERRLEEQGRATGKLEQYLRARELIG